ncbi:MAG: nucleoside monophosphate kinase [Patescibacteria group bacterium]
MNQKVFIFIGRSGCGKGTQGALLTEYLKKLNPEREMLYIQGGGEFREFIKGDSTTQKLSKGLYEADKLQPEFLSVYMWINLLVKNYDGNQHLIFDGAPRRKHEAGVLDSIFDFYGLSGPCAINIDVSEEWATERLAARHRQDDKSEDIRKRLAWYTTDVVPAIEFYQSNPKYKFIKVNGERSIDDIHKELIEKIGL